MGASAEWLGTNGTPPLEEAVKNGPRRFKLAWPVCLPRPLLDNLEEHTQRNHFKRKPNFKNFTLRGVK